MSSEESSIATLSHATFILHQNDDDVKMMRTSSTVSLQTALWGERL